MLQWPKGRLGRKRVIADIVQLLSLPETSDFLDGLDLECLYASEVTSGGMCSMLARVLFCILPPRRIRCVFWFASLEPR